MWSGGPVGLSQTSPIPRSPDGDKNQKANFFLSMILFPLFMVTTLKREWMMVWRRWWWCDDNYDEHAGNIDGNCDDNGDNDDDRVEGANMQAATSSHLQSRLHNLQYFISIIFIILILLSDRVITIFIIKKQNHFLRMIIDMIVKHSLKTLMNHSAISLEFTFVSPWCGSSRT